MNRQSSVVCYLTSVSFFGFLSSAVCPLSSVFMQNKPNSPIVQINASLFITKNYTIFTSLMKVKNKPNQTQFQMPLCIPKQWQENKAFIAHRLSTVPSVSTVNKDIRTLKRIFNLAIEPRGYLPEGQNPFAKIKKRKITENKVRYVKIEEYRALANEAKDLWWDALISIAYGSGLRRNEILHLTWADQ